VATILEFPDLLRLIDERAAAFRAAIAAAPGLDVPVPTCPEWTLADLVQHLGVRRRVWAATVAAGPTATAKPAPRSEPNAPQERDAVLAWWTASARELLAELRAAGPDRACWTEWGPTQSPHTCGAVARHQLQEITVHTYDAQVALGAPEPLPAEVALDGVEEFLFTCVGTTSAWPHKPTAFDFHATEGRSWRLTVDADGARTTLLAAADEDPEAAGVSVTGTASDHVLFMYDRIPADSLRIDGDAGLIDRLRAWEPAK
jgi:uncharacterized protein (TIGR03083 family)